MVIMSQSYDDDVGDIYIYNIVYLPWGKVT